jgi:hypothetical protein
MDWIPTTILWSFAFSASPSRPNVYSSCGMTCTPKPLIRGSPNHLKL